MPVTDAGPIVILTLEKHNDGVWVTRLKDRLEELVDIRVEVFSLESYVSLPTRSFHERPPWRALINRVSDATEPALHKACLALLKCCESLIWNIPVWNGSEAFVWCGSKWCHHAVFHRAGLSTPPSKRFSSYTKNKEIDPNGEYLVKPNAGGFGAGIKKWNMGNGTVKVDTAVSNDGIVLLQEYIPPRDNQIYRIWFLLGKIQCALVRTMTPVGNSRGTKEFTSGCAATADGASCALPQKEKTLPGREQKHDGVDEKVTMVPYKIPADIKAEIEDRLLPLIPSAHCGSVEFLYNNQGERFYFDLNLVSTLPLPETLKERDNTWPIDYDPWMELARAIVDHLKIT